MAAHENLERQRALSGDVDRLRIYADDLPQACPPEDAYPGGGTFYATHRSMPPDGLDFRTAASRGVFKTANECKRRGNSIMASMDDAMQLCRAYPDVHVYVSKGQLEPQHGMVLTDQTKNYPSHHTLWRFRDVTMHSIFITLV